MAGEMKITPDKLKVGDEVRIIAPSLTMQSISKEKIELAKQTLTSLGLEVSFGKHVYEKNLFESSPIGSRIDDLHEAFSNKNIKAVISARGGSSANQLLKYINYELIVANPKIFCGYSDITTLQNAVYKQSGLITYSGPSFSNFATQNLTYTLDYFKQMLFNYNPLNILPAQSWGDDDENTTINEGYWIINAGTASGTIIGGNLSSLQLLQGSQYMPPLKNSVLFIESDAMAGEHCVPEFDRALQALIYQPDFVNVKAIIFGRFETKFNMTLDKFKMIICLKPELDKMPIIANVDFGHTMPMITFPIGGTCDISVTEKSATIKIADK